MFWGGTEGFEGEVPASITNVRNEVVTRLHDHIWTCLSLYTKKEEEINISYLCY